MSSSPQGQAERLNVKVVQLSKQGDGVALAQGKEIYIPYALVGDLLEVEVGDPFVKGSKRCPGKILSYIQKSRDHSEPQCSLYTQCGGCQMQHMSFEAQSKLKAQDIESALANAGVADWPLVDVVQEQEYGFRHKSIRYFGMQEGRLVSGFYQGRSHKVISIDHCICETAVLSEVARSLTNLLAEHGVKAYVEQEYQGQAKNGHNDQSQQGIEKAVIKQEQGQQDCELVRAAMLRAGDGDLVQISLIVPAPISKELKHTLVAWASEHAKVASFYIGVNEQKGNVLFTSNQELIYGNPYLEISLLDFTFKVGPNSFMQVNHAVCTKLYQAAIAHCAEAQDARDGVALDLCCGVGTMTLGLAKHFSHVVGEEMVEPSIELARLNAQHNHVDHVSFVVGPLEQKLEEIIKEHGNKIKAVIVDPERTGIGEKCVKRLSKLKGPVKVSMIYCGLPALVRELPVMLKAGFKIDGVVGFDMFVHSSHIETLVMLSKD